MIIELLACGIRTILDLGTHGFSLNKNKIIFSPKFS
jgi:hypothetical protein